LRRVDDEHRALERETLETDASILDGITAYPAAGMEPFFVSRLDATHGDYGSYQAATALYHLNTPLARADLAKAIEDGSNRDAWLAQYLGLMGDTSYLPLLERLTNDADSGMRQSAVLALGALGGESALPQLGSLVEKANSDADRNNAIMALGNTATLKAVPFLLSLFNGTWDSANPVGFSLFLLTHHQLSPEEYRTPQTTSAAWKEWWAQNQTTARAYHPWEDCPEEKRAADR
jgi:hypothetical protein